MAQYTRFEIYVPVVFKMRRADPVTGAEVVLHQSVRSDQLARFVSETITRFGGITQANPLAPAPYKGWWKSASDPIEIDHLTVLYGLVRIYESDQAADYFAHWKAEFERDLHQSITLVIYYPIQTIGDFF
jgi:hypothetical protein